MSRTRRNTEGIYHSYFRHPKTENERKQLDAFLHDVEFEEYPVSGINHARKRMSHVPTAWDDEKYSAYYELYQAG